MYPIQGVILFHLGEGVFFFNLKSRKEIKLKESKIREDFLKTKMTMI